MILRLIRSSPLGQALLGKLYVDGVEFCSTIERTDKAIPELWYSVSVTMSPRFKRLLPIVNAVPGRSGIRFHRGSQPSHSQGCIIVGPNLPTWSSTEDKAARCSSSSPHSKTDFAPGTPYWKIEESAETEKALTDLLLQAQKKHEEIRLDVTHYQPTYTDEPCPSTECAQRNHELD